jgi:hypothetical protein
MIADIAALLTGEGTFTKYTGGLQRHHATRSLDSLTTSTRRAGGGNGQDIDDWLAAGQELTRHYR